MPSRRLYCRNCGYDLSPMFANGEESGTCPECGSVALWERLRLKHWRDRVRWRSIGFGAILAAFGSIVLLSAGFAWNSIGTIVPISVGVVPVATFAATIFAAASFHERVRVAAAGSEFYFFVLGVGLVSAIINVLVQAMIYSAAITAWVLATR